LPSGKHAGFGFCETKKIREAILASSKNSVIEYKEHTTVEIADSSVEHISLSADDKLIYVGLKNGSVWVYRTGAVRQVTGLL
jgi:hypothetical protein